jgi:hypothetical protein
MATPQHSQPRWRQLNSVETGQVKAAEGPDPTLSWSCNHCPQFLDNFHTFDNVINHLKALYACPALRNSVLYSLSVCVSCSHAIANPRTPADLCRSLDLPRPRVPFVREGLQYHCKRCPTSGVPNRRIFKLEGVQSHLKAK